MIFINPGFKYGTNERTKHNL